MTHSSIVPAQQGEHNLARIPSTDIISPEIRSELAKTGMFLGTELTIGRYGASACGIIVPDPVNEPDFWVDGRGGSSGKLRHEVTENMISVHGSDPVKLARRYNICPRFMILRTITLPAEFLNKLRSDSDLGPALVNKAIYTNSGLDTSTFVETDFKHSPEVRSIGDLFYEHDGEDEADFLNQLKKINEELITSVNMISGTPNAMLEQVPSWHAATEQPHIIREVETVNRQVVANLDDIAEKILGIEPIKMIREEEPKAQKHILPPSN